MTQARGMRIYSFKNGEECSITVGRETTTHFATKRTITVEELAEAAKGYDSGVSPVEQLPPHDAEHPVGKFFGKFADADGLAEGIMNQNAQENLWDHDNLFHAIADSGKCSNATVKKLGKKYCTH